MCAKMYRFDFWNIPKVIIDDYFSQWEIGEKGLPVTLLSLENCKSLPDKKQRLANVLSVLARLTGEVQLKVLRSRLAKIVRAIEAGQVRNLADTVRFFDKKDHSQAEILERLTEAFEELEGLPNSSLNWDDFLTAHGKIIVISTASDGIRKCSQFIDALLASLYAWKQHNRAARMNVVLDEIEDLCLERDGPIDTILRKGGKHSLFMLLASQGYSAGKDRLAKLIGNCGMQLIFHPKDECIDEIARNLGVDRQLLSILEQGECVAVGDFFNNRYGKNKQAAIRGKAYSAAAFLNHDEQETQDVSDKSSELSGEPLLEETADLNDDTNSEAEELSSVLLSLPDLNEMEHVEILSESQEITCSQSTETTADMPEVFDEEPERETSANEKPENVEAPTPEPTEVELGKLFPRVKEQPVLSESEPNGHKENPEMLIELELQQQFRNLISRFDPDYPGWNSDLADLFTRIMENHHFSSTAVREYVNKRLNDFMCTNPESFDYRKQLERLCSEIWPNTSVNSSASL